MAHSVRSRGRWEAAPIAPIHAMWHFAATQPAPIVPDDFPIKRIDGRANSRAKMRACRDTTGHGQVALYSGVRQRKMNAS